MYQAIFTITALLVLLITVLAIWITYDPDPTSGTILEKTSNPVKGSLSPKEYYVTITGHSGRHLRRKTGAGSFFWGDPHN